MPLKPLRTPSESDGKRSVAFGWQHSTLRLSVSAYAMPISTYPVGQTHVPCFVPLRASRVCKQRSLTTSKKSTTGFCDHKEAPEKDIFLNSVCVCAREFPFRSCMERQARKGKAKRISSKMVSSASSYQQGRLSNHFGYSFAKPTHTTDTTYNFSMQAFCKTKIG